MPSIADNPTAAQIRGAIYRADPDAWDVFEDPETWVYTENRDFSIRLLNREPLHERRIERPEWASALPSPTSAENELRVEFRGAPVDHLPALQLDDYRLTMVEPKDDPVSDPAVADRVLNEYEVQLSEIMSEDDFGSWIKQMDVRVAE